MDRQNPKTNRRMAMLSSHLNTTQDGPAPPPSGTMDEDHGGFEYTDVDHGLESVPAAGKRKHNSVEAAALAAAAVMEGEDRSIMGRMRAQLSGQLPEPLRPSVGFDANELTKVYFGNNSVELRRKIISWLANKAENDPVWARRYNQTKEEARRSTNARLVQYMAQNWADLNPHTHDRSDYIINMISPVYYDPDLATKHAVHSGLFCGGVGALSDSAFSDEILAKAADLRIRGCFAMTELGHGSNVRELETTATYIPETDEYEVNTPNDMAQKIWIGHSSEAHWALLFLTLIVNGVSEGVHAIIMPLRDEKTGQLLPGITWKDNGAKIGLNGVDNGRLWFDHVRVPRGYLCEKFGAVNDKGVYESPIKSKGRRFAAMLSALVGGRITVTQHSLVVSAIALNVAVRHSLERLQFGPPRQPEVPLMFYLTHQRRLLIPVARQYAMQILANYGLERYAVANAEDAKEVHVIAAGLKAVASWFMMDTMQKARECLGGQGITPQNRIGSLRADADVYTTYEGDNTVLMQQVTKDLLDEFRKNFKSPSHIVTFLQGEITRTVVSKNPFTRRFGGRAKLRSEEFQLSAIRYREHRLLKSLTQRMTQLTVAGVPAFQAWNQSLDLVQSVGRAHTERLALEHFVETVGSMPEGEPRRLLDLVRALYGLALIEDNLALFLRHKFFNGFVADNITYNVNSLLHSLSGYARELVDGFGIPEPLIGAAILNPETYAKDAPDFD